MRRALSLSAAALVMLLGAEASAADAGTDGGTSKDSGVSTQPSPNNPTVPLDSGTTSTSTEPVATEEDDSRCSFSPASSGGWSTALGLFAAASMMMMSRRRSRKR